MPHRGLVTAVQEQIGLKLEAVREQADVIVIDKVERPSARASGDAEGGRVNFPERVRQTRYGGDN